MASLLGNLKNGKHAFVKIQFYERRKLYSTHSSVCLKISPIYMVLHLINVKIFEWEL